MKKTYIYIDNEVTKNRSCYMLLYQQRKIHGFFGDNNNYEIINTPEKAHYIIIISCVVVEFFKEITLKSINKYILDQDKTIICSGCFCHLKHETEKFIGIKNLFFVDNDNINKFNSIFNDPELPKFSDVIEDHTADFKYNFDENNGWITIQHGCVWDCYFCNHNLTKKLRSKTENLIKLELKKRILEGIKHFRFTGDDVGSYGFDFKKRVNFIDLLQNLMKVDETFTFALGPVYPEMIIKYKNEIIKLIQSGRVTEIFTAAEHMSEDILKKMNRNYNLKKFLQIIQEIKRKFPYIKISTHIIYGYDGENEDSFHELLKVTEYFDQVQFFQMNQSDYFKKHFPNFKYNKQELHKKKKFLYKHYKEKKGFSVFWDHRIIAIKSKFNVKKENFIYHAF